MCRQLFLLTELLIELHSFSTLYFVSFPIPILTVVRSSSPDEMHNEFYYYGKLNFKSSYGEMYLFRIEVKCFSRILYLPKLLEFPHISSPSLLLNPFSPLNTSHHLFFSVIHYSLFVHSSLSLLTSPHPLSYFHLLQNPPL